MFKQHFYVLFLHQQLHSSHFFDYFCDCMMIVFYRLAARGKARNPGVLNSTGFPWIPMDSGRFCWIPQNSIGFYKIPQNSRIPEFRAFPLVLQSLSIGIHDEKQRNGYSNPANRKSIEHYQFYTKQSIS